MQSLACQHFYFLAKGQPALLCRTPDVHAPSLAAGKSDDELLEIFDRRIAPTSMIGMDVAARLISEWENEVVTQQQIATNDAVDPQKRTAAAPEMPVGLDRLRAILGHGGKDRS
jgi:hypothetical protein